jgi:hypothetical protein
MFQYYQCKQRIFFVILRIEDFKDLRLKLVKKVFKEVTS